MAKIHNDTNVKDNDALLKKKDRNGTDEEKGKIDRKGERLPIARNSKNSRQESTDLSSDIGGYSLTRDHDSNSNSNRRKRSRGLSILRIIFAVVILMLCVVTSVFVLRIVGNSRRGNLDENDNDVGELIVDSDINIPPSSNNSTLETTTTSTVVPENNPALDEVIEDEADTGDNGYGDTSGNLTANEDEGDDEDVEAGMAIIEVTERRLTPMEINGAGAVAVETLSEARAAPDLGYEREHAESHGIHKQRRLEELVGDYAASCDPCQYYDDSEDASFWTRDALQSFLESTVQRNLTYTEIWDALEDLDRGDTDRTVRTIYTNQTIFFNLKVFGSLQSGRWNREHVWPCSRGVRCGRNGEPQGPDYSDVHHVFASNYDGNEARGNKYFEYCSDTDVCKVPLKLNGKNIQDPPLCLGETCSDFSKIFQPPKAVRGVVARAIFYMDLRYPHLELVDSPNDDQMGNLSTLLEWHKNYPPEPQEIQRNDGACSRWQGNRNPFVDIPDLADIIYGDSAIYDIGNPFRDCSETSTAYIVKNEETDVFTDISTDVPADRSSDVPIDISTDAPIDISTDVPKFFSTDVPTDIAIDVTNDISTDVPSDISTDNITTVVDKEPPTNNSTKDTITANETASPVPYPTGFTGGSTAAAISTNVGLDDIYNNFQETPLGSIFLPQPGDVMIVGLNSDEPDLLALVALEDLAEGVVIHVTDNAFDKESGKFKTNEGTKSLTLNELIKSGTVFGFGEGLTKYSASWVDGPNNNFDLSTRGDTIVVYASTLTDPDKQVLLSAVSFADNDVLCDIPDSISDYTLALGREENFVFDGDKDAPKIKFQRQLLDNNFWVGSDEKLKLKLTNWSPVDQFRLIFPGEVMIIGVHSGNNVGVSAKNPDIVALLALNNLPKNAVIRMTDNAYNINTKTFNSGEGTLRFILPEIIPAGTVFGYGGDLLYGDMWENEVDKRFDLTVSGEKVAAGKGKSIIVRGDTVLVYVATTREPEDWTILSLIAFAGSGLPQIELNSRYSVRLGNEYNFVYTGQTTGSLIKLQNELVDIDNWLGSYTQEGVTMTNWQPPNHHVFKINESQFSSSERVSEANRSQISLVQVIILLSCFYLFV
jgi:endonuclease I